MNHYCPACGQPIHPVRAGSTRLDEVGQPRLHVRTLPRRAASLLHGYHCPRSPLTPR